MPIGFPFSKASQIASLTEEERQELERVRGAAKDPIDFNLGEAYEYLRDKGLEEPQALKSIAEKLSEKADFNYEGARKAQFTDEMIIARLIGRETDDLRPDLLQSFGEGFGRAVAREAPGAAAFAGAATVTPGGPMAKIAAGTAAGTAVGLFGDGDMVEDFLFSERQLLPSERSAARVGDTLGSALAWILPGKQIVKSIPDEVNLGSRRMLQAHQERRNKILNKERAFEGLSRKERKTLEKEPFKLKAARTSEKLLEGLGRGARETGIGTYATADLLATVIPAMTEGVLEYMYPGREEIIISGGIASSLIPTPTKIVAGGVSTATGAGKTALESVREEGGFFKAAAEGFGLRQAIQTRRQEKAAAYLAQAFEDAGGDPRKFAEELEAAIQADPEGAEMLTAGQLSNNPIVLLAERTLAEQNKYLDSAQQQAALQGAQRLTRLILTLEQTGNPELLQYAGQLKENALDAQFTALIEGKLAQAVGAADKLPNVRTGKPSTEIAMDQSALVKDAITEAHDAAKAISRQKYDAVNKLTMVDAKPLLNAYLLAKEKYLLKGEKLPAVLMAALEDMGLSDIKQLDRIDSQIRLLEQDPTIQSGQISGLNNVLDGLRDQKAKLIEEGLGQIELGEVIKFKNRAGAFYRQAKAGVEPFDPALFSEMTRGADVVLINRIVGEIPEEVALQRYVDEYGDIDIDIEELVAGLELTPDQKILKDAYQYSVAMNKAFRQTIAGDMTRMDRDLAQVIPFEEALDRVFTGNSSKVARQARELQEAMRFVYGDMDNRVHSLNGHMDAFLRNKMLEFTTVETQVLADGTTAEVPVISDSGLKSFKRKYDGVLKLPGMESLKNDLNELETANVALQTALAEGTEHYKNSMAQVGLANFLHRRRGLPKDGERPRLENASVVIGDILSQEDPVAALTRLANEIKEYAPAELLPEIQRGLFASVVEYAEQRSRNKTGIDFNKMYDVLFETGSVSSMTKFGRRSPSIMSVLEKQGALPKEQIEELKDFLQRGKNLQISLDAGIDDFINLKETSAMKDFFVRYAGARGMSQLSAASGVVPSIQETGAAAQLTRNVFVNFPQAALRDILVDVSSPGRASALAEYLRRGADRATTRQGLERVYDYVANTLLGAKGLLFAAPSRLADDNLGAQTDRRFEEQRRVAPPIPVPEAPAPMAELSIPQGMQATPPPPPPGPQMASQRQQYAQMFPFDTASDVIRQQGGIGSLMP